MNLVFLYGPPAAGKYTVGKELAELTGYKFFHGHVSNDFVRTLEPEPFHDSWPQLISTIRQAFMVTAAHEGVDLIFTFVYGGNVDKAWVTQLIHDVESAGGTMCFARLHPPQSVIEERIANDERKQMGKISSPENLASFQNGYDLYETIDHPNQIFVDTSVIPPKESALKIFQHFDLAHRN